jgi:hypothetical protein
MGESCWRVTNDELMPLTALKQLRNLELSQIVIAEADVTMFWQAMQAIRQEMGFSSCSAPSREHFGRLKFEF